MTLLQLEYALELNRIGSFNRAAKNIGISQPGLSLQIRKLEEEIGLTLFDRSQKKIKTTPKGALFLEKAQLILTQTKQLKELALQLSEEYSGQLTIGIIPTLAPYLLPLFIQKLNDQFPKLTIHVNEVVTEEIIQGIKEGKFDAGIIATPIESTITLTTKPLFYEGFELFVSNLHDLYASEEIEVDKIPPKDIWLLKEGNCLRNQVDDICSLNQKKSTSSSSFYFESNSIESLCRIVEYKGGITILPELTTLHFDSEREPMIKKLAGPRRVREISIIHLPNHVRKEIIDAIGELIKKSVPKKLLSKENSDLIHTSVIV
ncbi:MAG: LysR substrate-binding domain-containing protein [Bacteroidota bacterium]